MCGIVGLAGRHDLKWLLRMSHLIVHRGPDDDGIYHDKEANVSLAIRRLSIIDPVGGGQPMSNEDSSVCIVFNGEIYNAKEIRSQLVAKGHHFKSSHSDTEVLLRLYEEKQEDMVHDLNGMFAFVIYDKRRQKLFGARDHFGIKPLYYVELPGLFAFASELKCLLVLPQVKRELNVTEVFHLMSLGYLPNEQSIFSKIKRLAAAQQFTYNLKTYNLKVHKYWNIKFKPDEQVSEREWCQRIKDELQKAVRRWAISDVPIGCLLSGGIDSSTLVSLLAKNGASRVRTYSLGFTGSGEDNFNELPLSRLVAKRWETDHYELVLTPDKFLDELVSMVWHLDEPYGGGLPSWHVFKRMSQDVKVAVTGTGGDELFGSYGRFYPLEKYPKSVKSFRQHYFNYLYYFSDEVKRSMVFAPWTNEVPDTNQVLYSRYKQANSRAVRDQVAYLDITTQLSEEFLFMTDRFSMAHSVEARVPFLDRKFVELTFQIPAKLRTRPKKVKHLLLKSIGDLLPKKLLTAPKKGFSIPERLWHQGKLRPLIKHLLAPQRLKKQGIFQPLFYQQFVHPHLEGKMDFTNQVRTALMFQLWHLIFVEMKSIQAPSFSHRDIA